MLTGLKTCSQFILNRQSSVKRITNGLVAFLMVGSLVLGSSPAFVSAEETTETGSEENATAKLVVSEMARYETGAPFDEAGTEIVAYNPSNQYIYSVNGYETTIDIIDASKMADGELTLVKQVSLEDHDIKASDITSIELAPNHEFLAVAIPAEEKTDPGYVIFMNIEGEVLSQVEVGALPDNIVFTFDGTKVLTANEGEPDDDYEINPAGGVSIIEVTEDPAEITQDNVTTVEITAEDLPEDLRLLGPADLEAHLNVEPEFIAVDASDKFAYVSLQEVNAIAKFSIEDQAFEEIISLGYKDHSIEGQGMDPSDGDDKQEVRTVPTLGMHQPDAIALYYTPDGETYILTPNEGDSQDYDGYSEETKVADLAEEGLIELDAQYYEGFEQEELDQMVEDGLFEEDQLGSLRVTTDHPFKTDDVHNALVSYGGRSFTVVRGSDMEIVYDSGDDFEQIILEEVPEIFNADFEDFGEFEMDGRSDNKGPEPETVEVGIIDGVPYAFIAQERTGGFMIYDISNPEAPVYSSFFYDEKLEDISPEGLDFVAAENSPTGQPLLVVGYEVSGSIGVYSIATE